MTHLRLVLLGNFQATLDGYPADGLNSNHLRALLSYLAVESWREHPREHLASLLWPERSDREALNALRYALSNLRHALKDRQSPSPYLLVTRGSVQFNLASDHRLDLTEFQSLISRSDVPDLERAAGLYRGPFLEGLSLGDSPAFEEWAQLKVEEIRRSVLSLLDRLAICHMESGQTSQAAHWARRQLELEPYHEQAHRQLMMALAMGEGRPAALEHYEACRRLLAHDLGCEPEDATQALFAQIRDGALPKLFPHRKTAHDLNWAAPQEPILGLRFVSRDRELTRLGSLLEQAIAGLGGVALITGEPGSGKTTLLDQFGHQASQAHTGLIVLKGRCNAHGGSGDHYLPFREMLQTLAGDIEGKRSGGTLSPEQSRRAWEALPEVAKALVEHGPDLIDRFVPGEALLRRIAAISTPEKTRGWQAQLQEKAAHLRERPPATQPDLFSQVAQVLHMLSQHRPLLLEFDDLQWADAGTAALLFHLGRRLAGSHVLLICACRPQGLGALKGLQSHVPGSAPGIYAVLHELAREWGDVLVDLDKADGRAFIEDYIDSEPNRLGEDFRQNLYNHTAGHPLFTVELLHCFERLEMLTQDESRCWVEAPGLDWDYCPPQVEEVISAHLESLPDDDQALLQAASVQGEQFIAEVVAHVLGRDENTVLQRLSGPLRRQHRLVEAFSFERLVSNGRRLSHYRFRHALVQRSAYSRLDVVRRPQLHEATGQALEALYAARSEKPYNLAPTLARHFEAAGLNLAAARALYDAGSLAVRMSSFHQALKLFDHGLALLANEPAAPERTEIEQSLQVARLGPQRNLDGLSGAGVGGALTRATEAGAGEASGRSRLLMLLSEGERLSVMGRLTDALTHAERLLDLATKWEDEAFVALAHWRYGFTYNVIGNPQESERHFNWILAWLTPERSTVLRGLVGFGLNAHMLTFSALNQWWLGYPEQALKRSADAVTSAIEQGDHYGQAIATAVGSTLLFFLRRDQAELQERSEMCRRFCQQHGFTMWEIYAEVFCGWLAVMRGDDDAGVEDMQGTVARWQAKGMVAGADALTIVLADGILAAARRRPASDPVRLELLAIGLEAIEALLGLEVPCGQSYQAELYRLKGELLLERDGGVITLAAGDEALACFQQSLQSGREIGALAWELRAAISLVRLRMRQGEAHAAKLAEARVYLREVYERFTEGFEFPDLQEAAALIDQAG